LFFATLYGFLRHLKTSLVFCPVRAPAFARHRRKSGASSTIGWSQNAWDISTHHIIQQNNTKDVGSFFKHHTRHQKTSKKTPLTLRHIQSLHIRITRDFAANSRETHPPAPTSGASLAHEDRQSRARAQEAVNEVA
jgi:hypothetical protein